jgi:hypothetical protein
VQSASGTRWKTGLVDGLSITEKGLVDGGF